MPPSPALSARMMKEMYLTTTTRVSAQNTSDITPRTLAVSSVRAVTTSPLKSLCSAKHSLIEYSGDVPMSP
jgi:hypothetical protein